MNGGPIAYPTDPASRQQLAVDLAARGLKPTQGKRHFSSAKLNAMIAAMGQGTFDWHRASRQPVILGPNDEVLSGHHRIVAAHLAGIDLLAIVGPQVQRLSLNLRPVYDWIDVLPD